MMSSYAEGYARICPVCGEHPCNTDITHDAFIRPDAEEVVIEGVDWQIRDETDADLAEEDLFATRKDRARPRRPTRN